MASISRFGRAISSGRGLSDSNFSNRASVSSAVVSRRFVKSADESPDVIKMAPRTEKGTKTAMVWRGRFLRDNPSWCRLRQFRPSDNLLLGRGDPTEGVFNAFLRRLRCN